MQKEQAIKWSVSLFWVLNSHCQKLRYFSKKENYKTSPPIFEKKLAEKTIFHHIPPPPTHSWLSIAHWISFMCIVLTSMQFSPCYASHQTPSWIWRFTLLSLSLCYAINSIIASIAQQNKVSVFPICDINRIITLNLKILHHSTAPPSISVMYVNSMMPQYSITWTDKASGSDTWTK